MSEHANGGLGPPAVIYVIRHGEKPGDITPPAPGQPAPAPTAPFGVDFEGNEDVHSLLPRGWQRPGALAVLFAPAQGPLQAGLRTPGSLFSPTCGDPVKTAEHRTYQTIQGLSSRLSLQINNPFAEDEEPQLAELFVSGSAGVVLICWEHDHIPALASAIPTAPGTAIPAAWPGDRFDVIWSFTLVAGSDPAQYTCAQVPQQLLADDSDKVIPTG